MTAATLANTNNRLKALNDLTACKTMAMAGDIFFLLTFILLFVVNNNNKNNNNIACGISFMAREFSRLLNSCRRGFVILVVLVKK